MHVCHLQHIGGEQKVGLLLVRGLGLLNHLEGFVDLVAALHLQDFQDIIDVAELLERLDLALLLPSCLVVV